MVRKETWLGKDKVTAQLFGIVFASCPARASAAVRKVPVPHRFLRRRTKFRSALTVTQTSAIIPGIHATENCPSLAGVVGGRHSGFEDSSMGSNRRLPCRP